MRYISTSALRHCSMAVCLLAASAILMSCHDKKNSYAIEREQIENKGRLYLDSARHALAQNDFDKSRMYIMTLRREVPRAINAREAGILLLDSIEIAATSHELHHVDSLMQIEATSELQRQFDELCEKTKFYHRKLQHDKSLPVAQQQ